MSTPHRNTALRLALYAFLVLLISNLGAIVDRVLHPEIPYLDREHLIVGGVTAIAMVVLLIALEAYLARRRRVEATLRESEARFSDLVYSMADWAWEVDANGVYTFSSQKSYDFFGPSRGDVIGKTPFDLMPADEAARVGAVFAEIAAKKAPIVDLENWNIDAAGGLLCLLTNGVPILDDAGELMGYRGVDKEITRRKRAEEEIRRLNARLEERVHQRTAQLEASNRELEAFVYSASHDLRAPLRAIDGFSQMIADDAAARLDAQDKEHLQRVRAAAQRMALLIDHLLALSRTGRKDLLVEQVDLSAIAASVCEELRGAHPDRVLKTDVQPGLVVRADAVLLRVILTNLLDNAWKFTSGHATAHIEVGALELGREHAFYVKDDGAGLDVKTAPQLFGAFQRYHAAEQFDGDGIGLATVQRLVARHGGRVWAEAEVEKGATFYFTLPGPTASD
jgi:PAS domain S-box-containing protein